MNQIYEVSEVRISYTPSVKPSERAKISCSRERYKLLKERFYEADTIEYKEFFKVILLNRAGKVLGVYQVSEGGIDQTTVDVRIVLQAAILSNSSSLILSHNHPSGSLIPSSDDTIITDKIKKACELMSLKLLDHIILTKEGYYSFADECKI